MVVSRTSPQTRADAEAAAWVARLHGPERSAATEAGLQDWLRLDPAHARAFERATELWDLLPGAASVRAAQEQPPARYEPARRPVMAAVAGLIAMIGAVSGAYLYLHREAPSYVTAVGQQQMMTLEDGSRISLNTDTRLTVLYSAAERRIRLDRGEAMFDVAHNPKRPFIVASGNEEVRALGTSFMVRREDGKLAVTLIQGKVTVASRSGGVRRQVAILTPGERLVVASTETPVIDRPAMTEVTAWRRGEAVFDDTRLADAVRELNRYGPTHILIAEPAIADLRVSGVFATNDAAEFANAVAALNGLQIQRRGDTIEIGP